VSRVSARLQFLLIGRHVAVDHGHPCAHDAGLQKYQPMPVGTIVSLTNTKP